MQAGRWWIARFRYHHHWFDGVVGHGQGDRARRAGPGRVAADAEHDHGHIGVAEGADNPLGRDADGQPQLNGRPRGQQAFGLDVVLAEVEPTTGSRSCRPSTTAVSSTGRAGALASIAARIVLSSAPPSIPARTAASWHRAGRRSAPPAQAGVPAPGRR
jgi:hypothetical protein